MVTFDCPWCTEPALVETPAGELACERCGVRAELAPDPAVERIARAA